jgi:mono/diheme cytochrome c family protein
MDSPVRTDEIDFRALLRSPRQLFGYTFVYLVIVLVVLGILYARRLDEIGRASVVPLQLADSTATVQEIPLQAPRNIAPVDLASVAAPTAMLLGRGKELFLATCSSCHGAAGAGDGPSAATMTPKPRNFQSAAGWTNGPKITQMYKTLQEGIVRNGMASYSYIPPADRFAIIHYVRTLMPSPPIENLQELQALEATYQLSRGTQVPGTVPIRVAETKLLEESAAGRARATRLEMLIRSGAGDPLLASSTADARRLATATLADGGRILELPATDFSRLVTADPLSLGLRAGVARLGDNDLGRLQRALVSAAGTTLE